MSFFSKPKIVLWPKTKSVDVYIDRKENNTLSFDFNLWQKCSDKDLESLALYFKQNKIDSVSVLVPDDIIFTKSFTYDTKIESIEKKEVIGLASNLVNFKIDPEAIDYKLIQTEDKKTIIQSFIYDKPKLDQLTANLESIDVKISKLNSVASAISNTISSIYKQDFFLIYPLNDQEYTILLSKDNSVYLTANLKGPSLDIQKILNYSTFYFSNITKKVYAPEGHDLEIISTTEIEKTIYNESQIAQSLLKASNLPLPVLGEMSTSISHNNDIIKPETNISSSHKIMENKKTNILPIIAAFIFTAALASVIIWFVLNKNNDVVEAPIVEDIVETITPTAIPTPTIAEISKTIKIQVLNATDITGQAATLKDTLTALGFENVSTGNAKTTATENSVQVKDASTSAYFGSQLMTSFPATYTTDLTATANYDVVFTIGTDLSTGAAAVSNVTPTVTKTATPSVTKAVTPTVEEE